MYGLLFKISKNIVKTYSKYQNPNYLYYYQYENFKDLKIVIAMEYR